MRRLSLSVCVLAAVISAGPGAEARSSRRIALNVSPRDVLIDDRVEIRATGLLPRQTVVLQALAPDVHGRVWRSRVSYRAASTGVVDTRRAMRLFWSLIPADGRRVSNSSFVPPFQGPVTITMLVNGRPAAHATIQRRLAAPGLVTHDYAVGDAGFVGTFYEIPSTTPRPAVLSLGGSAGGHGALHDPLLASRGYPTLSLAYFNEPGLPAHLQNIPLEYFANALRWLGAQPGVDPNRIGVVGLSRGAEVAILLGATYPDLVDGVFACTTSAQVLGGLPSGVAWTLDGSPTPFGPLPVTMIIAPVVITGGGKDEIIDSAVAARTLAGAARANGQTNVVAHVYPNAGHGVGCRIPNIPIPAEYQLSPTTTEEAGGTPAANAQAAAVTWPLLLRFLASLPAR
jgi:dienelactone hydrolase